MRTRALLIGGSLAQPSHTSALLAAASDALAERGATVERWDLAERPLELADPAEHSRPIAYRSEPGRSLVQAAGRADALVLVSPLYHNSYSGAVKNALDHLCARELRGKPVALLGHSGRLPSSQALDHLRLVVRALAALAISTQLVVVDADWTLDGGTYRLVGRHAEARLASTLDELLALTERLQPTILRIDGHSSKVALGREGRD